MSGRVSIWMVGALCAAICGLVPAGLAGAAELPDGRNYEQVTPEEKHGADVYQPPIWSDTHYELELKRDASTGIATEYTFQAAADGSGIAYVAAATVGGTENEGFYGGNEYLATRSAGGGWSNRALSPEGAPSALYQAFSPNLTSAFVNSVEPLSPVAPGFGEGKTNARSYDVLYSTSTAGDEFVPLFSTKPPYRSLEAFGTAPGTFNEPTLEVNSQRAARGFLAFEGASSDSSHLLFAANDALTGASEGRPASEGGEGAEFENENNLYEAVGGQLRLVNVLPNGTTRANAGFGSGRPLFNHVISADGSRIFWTDLSTGHIYMRENGVKTIEISPEGTYQTATSDGSTVFYTNGDLYAYDTTSGRTTDLTPGVAVEQVLGSSENGEYIYYLTGGQKLALWHDGASTSITSSPIKISQEQIKAEVTPDGHSIVFTLGGTMTYPEVHENFIQRVEVYDADTDTLYCASCTANGTVGNLQTSNAGNVYQPRWITTNGAHVFFVSLEGLVPQDTNEEQDVYEWERPGTGGCTEAGGCVYLLTGGTSTDQTSFLDASESGEDVFVVTRANLVGSDEDGLFDVYDVRVGQRPAALPVCTGTGCQGVPSAPPIFATPPSVTFEGVGNLAAPAKQEKPKQKPKHKQKSKHKKKAKHRKSKAKKSAHEANGRKRSSSEGGRS